MNFLKLINEKIEKSNLFFICAIPFVLALIVRIIGMIVLQKLSGHTIIIDDSVVYLRQAHNILSGQWAGQFPNGYPLIVALFLPFPASEILLVALNIILSSCVASLTGLIVWQRTKSKLFCLLAGLIVAFWYNQINWSTMILSEASTTFFLILGILLIIRGKDYFGSLAIGFTSVIRTTLLPMGLLIAFYRHSYKILLGFLIPAVLMLGVSYYFTGGFSIGSNLAENIYISTHLSPNGQIIWGFPPHISTLSATKVYVDHFLSNPSQFIYQRAQQLWILWGFWPFTQAHGLFLDILLKILIGLRFPLLFFGLLFYFISRRKSREDILLLIPIFVLTAVHTTLFASIRYTYPVEPLLIALFITHFYFFLQEKQWIQNKNLL